jgi:hypothetical protein
MAVHMIQSLILPGTSLYDDLCLLFQLVRWHSAEWLGYSVRKGYTSASNALPATVNGLGYCIYLGSQDYVMDSSGSTQQVPLYFSSRKLTSNLSVVLCVARSLFSYLTVSYKNYNVIHA